MLRILHELYHARALQHGFDATETPYAMEFPPAEVARGIEHWVAMFEIYVPARGAQAVAEAVGMQQIYNSLVPRGLDTTEQQFTATTFRALLCDKVKAYCVANGLPEQGTVPRYARAASGSNKFFGVRLAATDAA
eukprot:2721224-Prymnesium_polylepis.1